MTGVAVVIPCFDLGRFVSEAVQSVRGQTRPAAELVIVDDGSTALQTRHVLARLNREGVHVVRQPRGGPAGARNAGIGLTTSAYILCLDADDVLDPQAIARLAGTLDDRPDLDFVSCALEAFGASSYRYTPPPCTWAATLSRGGPHISTMFRRAMWRDAGGFNPALSGYEPADFWLSALERGARGEVLPDVLLRYRVRPDSRYAAAIRSERYSTVARDLYRRHWPPPDRDAGAALLLDKEAFLDEQRAHQRQLRARIEAAREKAPGRTPAPTPSPGPAAWGDVRRTTPMSDRWGIDRGRPVDRRYIEAFLAAHRDDIQGRVLEIKDDGYARQFGDGRVARCDVLDVDAANPRATLVADLADAATVPAGEYDCVILTQTLHIIRDVRAALASAIGALRPGGVLLCTLPSVSRVSFEDGGLDDGDFWRFTEASIRWLLRDLVPFEHVEIEPRGNLVTGAAFLMGLAENDVPAEAFDHDDRWFPLLHTVRVTRPWSPARPSRRARSGQRAAVLMYHRVDAPAMRQSGSIDAEALRAQLRQIARDCDPVPLDDLVSAARTNRLPPRAVAVTFDDGYAECLTTVAPMLAEAGVPATFYVTTVALHGGEYYWDTLARIFAGGERLPPALDLFGDGSWTRPVITADERRAAHQAIVELLYPASAATRDEVIRRLVEWAGVDPVGGPAFRRLDAEGIRELAGRPGVTIGAHTHHHLRLPSQPDGVKWREIRGSRDVLERLLGRPVTTFAYPYGELDGRTAMLVRAAGYDHAVAVDDAHVTNATDRLVLPRIEVTSRAPFDPFARL